MYDLLSELRPAPAVGARTGGVTAAAGRLRTGPDCGGREVAGSVSRKQDVERSGDLIAVSFQRGHGTPKLFRGNAGDGLGQDDMRDAVDVEHRIEVANGGGTRGAGNNRTTARVFRCSSRWAWTSTM